MRNPLVLSYPVTLLPIPPHPIQVFQGYTPRHYTNPEGEALAREDGGTCATGVPLDPKYDDPLVTKLEVALEEAVKEHAEYFKLLNITRMTMPRRDAHPATANTNYGIYRLSMYGWLMLIALT